MYVLFYNVLCVYQLGVLCKISLKLGIFDLGTVWVSTRRAYRAVEICFSLGRERSYKNNHDIIRKGENWAFFWHPHILNRLENGDAVADNVAVAAVLSVVKVMKGQNLKFFTQIINLQCIFPIIALSITPFSFSRLSPRPSKTHGIQSLNPSFRPCCG